MTKVATAPYGVHPGDPIHPNQLIRLPPDEEALPVDDGAFWRYSLGDNAPAGHPLRKPLFFLKHVYDVAGRLKGAYRLHDAEPAKQHELVREVVEKTLAERNAITAEGTLTGRLGRGRASPNSPSTDILCAGASVQQYWCDGPVSVIVRTRDLIPPEIPDAGGSVSAVLTVVPRDSPKWTRILSGEPIRTGEETYLINVGQRFSVAHHCVWVEDPSHTMFGGPPRTV